MSFIVEAVRIVKDLVLMLCKIISDVLTVCSNQLRIIFAVVVAVMWVSIPVSGLERFWAGADCVLHRAAMYPSPGSVLFSHKYTLSCFQRSKVEDCF